MEPGPGARPPPSPQHAHPARAGPAAPESCPPPCRERERETEARDRRRRAPVGLGLRIHNSTPSCPVGAPHNIYACPAMHASNLSQINSGESWKRGFVGCLATHPCGTGRALKMLIKWRIALRMISEQSGLCRYAGWSRAKCSSAIIES